MRPNFQTAVLAIPANGRLAMPIELDFTSAAALDFDLTEDLMTPGAMGFVQGVFVENGAHGDPLTLTFYNPANQGFVLRIPGKCETWQPLLLTPTACRFRAVSEIRAGHIVQISLCNFPVQPIMWNTP